MKYKLTTEFLEDIPQGVDTIFLIEAKDEEEFYKILISDPFKYNLCIRNKDENYIYSSYIESFFRASYTKLSKVDFEKLFIEEILPSDLEIFLNKDDSECKIIYYIEKIE